MNIRPILTSLTMIACLGLFGQATVTWDGGAGTTNWEDDLNWDTDAEPATGDIVRFSSGGIILVTGTPTNNPGRISVQTTGTIVTLDLDLTIANSSDNYGITVANNSTLILGAAGNNRTFNISPDAVRDGIAIFAGQANATITIASSTNVNITQGTNGLNLLNSTLSFTNEGTITVSGATARGIRVDGGLFTNNGLISVTASVPDAIELNGGTFDNPSGGNLSVTNATTNAIELAGGVLTNSGTITLTSTVATDGILYTNGTLTNTNGGVLTITAPTDDCIDVNASNFSNAGTINVTVQSAASANNNGIIIESGGVLTNSGTLNADGAASGSARAIQISAGGTLSNSGTVNVSNGNLGAATRINGGILNNNPGGRYEMNTTRISMNDGAVNNQGFMRSTHSAQGILRTGTGGTATNLAFFDFLNTSNFSEGSVGTNVDAGLDIRNDATTFEASSADRVTDIGIDVAYTWYADAANTTQVGSNDASGLLIFEEEDIDPNTPSTETIFTVYGADVTLTANNVLPVELVFFDLKKKKDKVCATWKTASELNNEGFELQRSVDGSDWQTLTLVKGNGTTSVPKEYHFDDASPFSGINYYRLVQRDFDGRYEIFPARVIEWDTDFVQLQVYPNPVHCSARIGIAGNLPIDSFKLYDAAGNQLPVSLIDHNELDLSGLDPGIYFLHLEIDDSEKVARILKK